MPFMTIWSRQQLSAHLGRLLGAARLVWQASPFWTSINLLLVVFQGVLPLAALFAMKQIVDTVASGVNTFTPLAAMRPLLWWVAMAGVIALLQILCRSLADLASEAQSHLVTDQVSDTLHAQSVAVDLAYYEDPRYHDTLQRAQQEAPYRPVNIVNNLLQIGQSAIALLGIAGILLAYNWKVGVALFVVALPGALVRLYFARRAFGLQQQQTHAERQCSYYHFLLTDSAFAKEVRLFKLGDIFRCRFRDLRKLLREARIGLARRRVFSDLLAQGLASLAIFGALGFTAYQALRGEITLGAMVMYYQAFQTGLTNVQAVLRGLAGLYEHSLFLTNYQEFLALQPTLVTNAPAQALPRDDAEGIRFRNVSFRYTGNERDALTHIDLEIKPGQVIALVGGNGSGKTTLTKLLCRLYDPTDGDISLNGTSIRHFDPAEWRRNISVVFQDFVRYFLTARENIWLGNAQLDLPTAPVEAAAQSAGANGFLERLPKQYDTMLGHIFFGGHELSTGEWQRVAVARAFLRDDSRLIILDEPSSALDPLAESELFHRLRDLIAGRSAVIVSHRFSTVTIADYIYVMDQGRIVERGTHQDLMRLQGLYAHMYTVQAEQYQREEDRAGVAPAS